MVSSRCFCMKSRRLCQGNPLSPSSAMPAIQINNIIASDRSLLSLQIVLGVNSGLQAIPKIRSQPQMLTNLQLTQLTQEISDLAARLILSLIATHKQNQEQSSGNLPVFKQSSILPKPFSEVKVEAPLETEPWVKIEDGDPGRRTYRSYSVEFKRNLVQEIKDQAEATGQSINTVLRAKAKLHGIHPKNLSRWCSLEEIKQREGGRKAMLPQLQAQLAEYIRQNPKCKRKDAIQRARCLYSELEGPARGQFTFSKGWYQRFRSRHFPREAPHSAHMKYEEQSK